MGGRKEIIDTCGRDTKEWQDAQVRYGQLGEDLGRGLRYVLVVDGWEGSWIIGENVNECMRIWKNWNSGE